MDFALHYFENIEGLREASLEKLFAIRQYVTEEQFEQIRAQRRKLRNW